MLDHPKRTIGGKTIRFFILTPFIDIGEKRSKGWGSPQKYITNERFKSKIKSFKFIDKSENNIGTQIADLIAYPIATKIIYPERVNLAFEVLEDKIYKQFSDSDYLGYGLKIFP